EYRAPSSACDTAATAACFVQRVELAVATDGRLRTILAAIVRSSAAGNRGTRAGGADLYEAGAPGWERGSLGSYRGALDLRWDRSASYWICPGVGGRARSRRGQCWTAGRVWTLFSCRNDPPEESRSPCVARARGELGDGVCFRTCSRERARRRHGGGIRAEAPRDPAVLDHPQGWHVVGEISMHLEHQHRTAVDLGVNVEPLHALEVLRLRLIEMRECPRSPLIGRSLLMASIAVRKPSMLPRNCACTLR